MIDNILIIQPDDHIHSQCYYDVAMSFAQSISPRPLLTTNPEACDNGVTLIFGAHLISHFKGTLTGNNYIIYQSEQLGSDSILITPEYLELLKSHPIWDYSALNIQYLESNGIKATHVPIGYSRCLSNIKTGKSVSFNSKTLSPDFADWSGVYPTVDHNGKYVQDVDICFYGSVNERRLKIIEELKVKTLPFDDNGTIIERPLVVASFIGYGGFRDKLIARSKIVLNLHYYETAIHEIFRTAHLFANKKCVVSELGKDILLEEPFYLSGGFVPYDSVVNTCMEFLTDDTRRNNCADTQWGIFSQTSQKEILKGVV